MEDKKEIIIEADASMEEIVKMFRDLKEKKAALDKEIKKVINPQIEELTTLIIAKMQGEGATKISTDFGSCSTSTKDYASISDFATFIHYIDTHGAYELIQKRPNDAPLRLIWDDEEAGEVPGLGKYEKTTLNFRKK